MNKNEIKLPPDSIFSLEEVKKFRRETKGIQNVIHLNNAGAGLMPNIVTEKQLQHINLEAEIGGYEAAEFRADAVEEFYTESALLFNCKASNIAFTASATDAYTRALFAISFKEGDVILTDKDDFVSNQIQFLSLKKRFGVKIVHINNAPPSSRMAGNISSSTSRVSTFKADEGLKQNIDKLEIYLAGKLST